MALTASSPLSAIHAQYVANRLYALHGSVAEATLFSEAAAWLVMKPIESEDKDGRVQFDRKQVQADLQACDAWLSQFAAASPNAAARVTKASFVRFRD